MKGNKRKNNARPDLVTFEKLSNQAKEDYGLAVAMLAAKNSKVVSEESVRKKTQKLILLTEIIFSTGCR